MGLNISILAVCLWLAIGASMAPCGEVRFSVREDGAEELVPCRIHLIDAAGRPVLPVKYPAFRTHFTISGKALLHLEPGSYRVGIERGPEYTRIDSNWDVPGESAVEFEYKLHRIAHLTSEGWWSGDLHVHRPPADIEALMRGEDLHFAPIVTWWRARTQWMALEIEPPVERIFDGDRFYDLGAGEDEREGGALQFFGMESPLPLEHEPVNGRPASAFLAQAGHSGARIVIEKPFWSDVPIWLASGMVSSIEIANNHMLRHGVIDNEAWGRTRDVDRLPGPHGNGLWSQEIYYHLLESGLRVPPSAGSASGVIANPLGYNRVYVHLEGDPTYEKWWMGLLSGRSFVTNGPLLRVRANGRLPGHVFQVPPDEGLQMDLTVQLDSLDPVASVELVQNGVVKQTVTGEAWRHGKRLAQFRVESSGWFLVRAMADVKETFRFASTAPYYFESPGRAPRISRSSVQFFLDWTRERARQIETLEAGVQAEALAIQRNAESFWQARLAAATDP